MKKSHFCALCGLGLLLFYVCQAQWQRKENIFMNVLAMFCYSSQGYIERIVSEQTKEKQTAYLNRLTKLLEMPQSSKTFFQGFDSSPCTIRKKLLNKQTWSSKGNNHFLIQNMFDNHTLCLVTNWVSFMTCIEGSGLNTVAHMPTMSVQNMPHDAAIIFKLDGSGTIAVVHNMCATAHSGFLAQRGGPVSNFCSETHY